MNHNSIEYGYRVEARVRDFIKNLVVELDDGILSENWREVSFPVKDPSGIRLYTHNELYSYEAAIGLAWSTVADNKIAGVECRLVQYKLETRQTLDRLGVVDIPIIAEVICREVALVPETATPPANP